MVRLEASTSSVRAPPCRLPRFAGERVTPGTEPANAPGNTSGGVCGVCRGLSFGEISGSSPVCTTAS